jgi:O-antigen/teichoic acid export membrane protein
MYSGLTLTIQQGGFMEAIFGINWQLIIVVIVAVQTILRLVAELLTSLGNMLNKPELSAAAKTLGVVIYWLGKIIGFFGLGVPTAVKAEISGK